MFFLPTEGSGVTANIGCLPGTFTGTIRNGKVIDGYVKPDESVRKRLALYGIELDDQFDKPPKNDQDDEDFDIDEDPTFAQHAGKFTENEDGSYTLSDIERIGIEDGDVKDLNYGDILFEGSTFNGQTVVEGSVQIAKNGEYISVEKNKNGAWAASGYAILESNVAIEGTDRVVSTYSIYGPSGLVGVVDFYPEDLQEGDTFNLPGVGKVRFDGTKLIVVRGEEEDDESFEARTLALENIMEAKNEIEDMESNWDKYREEYRDSEGKQYTLQQYKEILYLTLSMSNQVILSGDKENEKKGLVFDFANIRDWWSNITINDDGSYSFLASFKVDYLCGSHHNKGIFEGVLANGFFSG